MIEVLPTLYVARHGETDRSLSGQHTGLTDLPLTKLGEVNARRLGNALRGHHFAKVLTSPLQRARRTCELADFGDEAEVDPDLVEWNYGEYEGLRTEEINAKRPDRELFREGCPGGESAEDIAVRVARVRRLQQDVLVFSSRHFLRVLAARWLRLPARAGEYFLLSTASLSLLLYEHNLNHLWSSCGMTYIT